MLDELDFGPNSTGQITWRTLIALCWDLNGLLPLERKCESQTFTPARAIEKESRERTGTTLFSKASINLGPLQSEQ